MADFFTPDGVFGLPGMSAGVVAAGPLLFASGQIALDDAGAVVGEGDFARQVEQTMHNLAAVLRAGGASFKDVIKTNVYLTDRAHLAAWRTLRDDYFSAPYPASTLVIVQLLSPALLIEIDAVASIPQQSR